MSVDNCSVLSDWVVTCGCLSSSEDGAEAARVVSGWLPGPEGLVVTCGFLSIVEVGEEAAGVLVGCLGCETVTYGFLFSVEDVVDGCCWMLAVVTCGCVN